MMTSINRNFFNTPVAQPARNILDPLKVLQPENNLTDLKILALCASFQEYMPPVPRFCMALKFRLSRTPKTASLQVAPLSQPNQAPKPATIPQQEKPQSIEKAKVSSKKVKSPEPDESKADESKSDESKSNQAKDKSAEAKVATKKAKNSVVDDEETETESSESQETDDEESVTDSSESSDSEEEVKPKREKAIMPTKIKKQPLTLQIFNEMLKYNLGNAKRYSYTPRGEADQTRQVQSKDRKRRNLINRIIRINRGSAKKKEVDNVLRVYEKAKQKY